MITPVLNVHRHQIKLIPELRLRGNELSTNAPAVFDSNRSEDRSSKAFLPATPRAASELFNLERGLINYQTRSHG